MTLAELIDFENKVNVVDVGASSITGDGDPPYKPLLDSGIAEVIGFDLNLDAISELNLRKGKNENYLPYAVYDGKEQELKICRSAGMTSFLEPNVELLNYFHGFPEWGKVQERLPIQTVRLDDITEIKEIDYLKIDIQGGELEVFRNGINRLHDCLVIHTEVEFLPMYQGQPLFSEVELFLREQGYIFHQFSPLVSRVIQPAVFNVDGSEDIYRGLSQVFWADAVFIKDFTNFDQLSTINQKKIAIILHECYSSVDLALQALMTHDTKSNATAAEKYINSSLLKKQLGLE